jgi:pimeloyl-ACP methyl ester carboxylesterase
MNKFLINSVSVKIIGILVFTIVLLNSVLAQRKFEITEIQLPAGASEYYFNSLNDYAEIVGGGKFRRCIDDPGGGGSFTNPKVEKLNAVNSKLVEVCFGEYKPIYWSPETGNLNLAIPETLGSGEKTLGYGAQINNSGLIMGSALFQQININEYTSAVKWNGFAGYMSPVSGPSSENTYSIQSIAVGLNNNNQILGVKCYDQSSNPPFCDSHYRNRYFVNENWITPAYVPLKPLENWELASNYNDRGEAIFRYYDGIGNINDHDILLYSSGSMHSIKSQIVDTGATYFGLTKTGDIFYNTADKLYWIRKPLENNPNNRKTINLNNVGISLTGVNDSEQFLGYDGNLQQFVIWDEVSHSMTIKLPEDSGWVITSVVDINNNGQILAKAIKNGIEKYLLLTPKPPPPLIFVPGTMGSELYLRSDHQKYWISPFSGTGLGYNKYMTLDSSSSYYLGDDAFSAKDALRKVNVPAFGDKIVYDALIENLKQYGGYKEYRLFPDIWGTPPPSEGGCDTVQINSSDPSKNPTLFVFPYDFRKDNAVSAEKLATFVRCVQQFHPNTPINLLGHSQGGIVSRRYIIDHPNDHGIGKLITIATPYLGAPEAIYKMEQGGSWKGDGWGDIETVGFNIAAITPSQIKFLSKHFKSVHQLLPSREYGNLYGRPPLKEVGDVDGNGVLDEFYDYDKFINFMNNEFSTNPGNTGKAFHDCLPQNMTKCQDDWREDISGVQYTHLVGQQARDRTTVLIEVKNEAVLIPDAPLSTYTLHKIFEPIKGPGDGTVPEISASRNNRIDLNLNAPGAFRATFFALDNEGRLDESKDPEYEHNGLTKNKRILLYVLFRLGLAVDPNPDLLNLKNNKISTMNLDGINRGNLPLPQRNESFYTKIIGISDVEMSDDQGNKTTRDGDIFINKVVGLDYEIIGDNALFLTFPVNPTHFAKFQVGNSPFSLDVVKGMSNQNPNLAVRYKDVFLPAGTNVQLKVTNLAAVVLQYDSNGDGTYDTTIPPTASSTGTTASDMTPPKVNINITQFGASSTVAISAIDAESGIKQIMYSINGQGFNIYTSPVTLNVSSPTTILAVADNNVGIRSGVYRKNILVPTSANSSISGRVTNIRGSARTIITLTRGSTGESVFVRPNQLGYFRFVNLASGEEYILTPSRKGYRFEPQNRLVSLSEDLDNIDFQALLGGQ